MSYYLAHSLVRLRGEIDARWPNRDRTSDGWIGDPSHAARASDHNPDYNAGGVVRAIDIDRDGIDLQTVLDAVIGDHRVWYVIFEGHIYSRTHGWARHPYTGSNPHDKHIHVSIARDKAAEEDTSRWLALPQRKRKTRGKHVDAAIRSAKRAARAAQRRDRMRRYRILASALDILHKLKAH